MKTILSNRDIRDILSQSDLDHYTDRLVKNKAALDVITKSLEDNTTEKNFSQYKRLIKAATEETAKERAEREQEEETKKEMGLGPQDSIEDLAEKEAEKESERQEKGAAKEKRTKKEKAEIVQHKILKDWQEVLPKLEALSNVEGNGPLIKIYEGIIDNIDYKGNREGGSEGFIFGLQKLMRHKLVSKDKKSIRSYTDNTISSQLGALNEEGNKRIYTKRTYKTTGSGSDKIREPKPEERIDIAALENEIRKACEKNVSWDFEKLEKETQRINAIITKLEKKAAGVKAAIISIGKEQYEEPKIEERVKKIIKEHEKDLRQITEDISELEERIVSQKEGDAEYEKEFELNTSGGKRKTRLPIMNASITHIPLLALIHEHIFKRLPQFYLKKHSTTITTKKGDKIVERTVATLETELNKLRDEVMRGIKTAEPRKYKQKYPSGPKDENTSLTDSSKEQFQTKLTIVGFNQTLEEIDDIHEIISVLQEDKREIIETIDEQAKRYEEKAKEVGEKAKEDSKIFDEEMADLKLDMEKYTALSDELVSANKDIPEKARKVGAGDGVVLNAPNPQRLRWYKGALKTIEEGESASKVGIREGSSKEKEMQGKILEIIEQLEGMDAIAEEAENALVTESGATKEEVQQQMTAYQKGISAAKKPENVVEQKFQYNQWKEELKILTDSIATFEGKHSKSPEKFLAEYDKLTDSHNNTIERLVASDLKQLIKDTIDREKRLKRKKEQIDTDLPLAHATKRRIYVKEYQESLDNMKEDIEEVINKKIKRLYDIKAVMVEIEEEESNIDSRNKKLRARMPQTGWKKTMTGSYQRKEETKPNIVRLTTAVEKINDIKADIDSASKQLDREMKKQVSKHNVGISNFKTSTSEKRTSGQSLTDSSKLMLKEVEETIGILTSPKDITYLKRLEYNYKELLITYRTEVEKLDNI